MMTTIQFYDLFFSPMPMASYPDDAGDSDAMATTSRVDRRYCPLDAINLELAELRDRGGFDGDND